MTEYVVDRENVWPYGSQREEIVRCRDCLHVSYDGVLSTGWCNENCREVRPDSFCSWAERKVE